MFLTVPWGDSEMYKITMFLVFELQNTSSNYNSRRQTFLNPTVHKAALFLWSHAMLIPFKRKHAKKKSSKASWWCRIPQLSDGRWSSTLIHPVAQHESQEPQWSSHESCCLQTTLKTPLVFLPLFHESNRNKKVFVASNTHHLSVILILL